MASKKTSKPRTDSSVIESGKIQELGNFKNTEDPKRKWTGIHYWVSNIICALIVLVFLYLILTAQTVPEFLIGIVGSIVGYYIARAPYDLK